MDYLKYQQLFDEILESEQQSYPYTDMHYLDYTKLNRSRMKRWDKQLKLDEELITMLKAITSPQHWIIITEPWCGDAAHSIPFMIAMKSHSNFITYDIQLRDSEPYLINQYLTNGSKSIPKLIIKDSNGNDLFNWGPRPKQAQELLDKLKGENANFETIKLEIQHWYNHDKGISLCRELETLLGKLKPT